MVNSAALAVFAQLLGPKGYCDDPEEISPWLKDWRGLYEGKAAAMLSPASTTEVAAVVRLAADLGISLVPQGGNTSMVGGATPSPEGESLILSLRRMNAIRSIDRDAGIAVVEAGVILSTLHDAAVSESMRFPLSLGAKGSATVGGLCSTNAGGTQVLRFGTMRNLVLGLEAVLPDGSIHDGLAPLKKDTRGYDVNQLLIGAEGTIGVITAAALRLVPDVADRAVGWFGIKSPVDALKALRQMERHSGDAIESFELIPHESLALVLKHIPGTRAPLESEHRWHVLVELVSKGPAVKADDRLAALAQSVLGEDLAQDAVIAASKAQEHDFWRLRESISEAERAEGPTIAHDISVPVDDMPAFILKAQQKVAAAFPDLIASAFGHLGDGNVHFHVRAKGKVNAGEWRLAVGKPASRLVYDLTVGAGGSISAEHGIGQMKRAELGRLSSPARIAVLRGVKSALDPNGIMNPGKLVPLASETPGA